MPSRSAKRPRGGEDELRHAARGRDRERVGVEATLLAQQREEQRLLDTAPPRRARDRVRVRHRVQARPQLARPDRLGHAIADALGEHLGDVDRAAHVAAAIEACAGGEGERGTARRKAARATAVAPSFHRPSASRVSSGADRSSSHSGQAAGGTGVSDSDLAQRSVRRGALGELRARQRAAGLDSRPAAARPRPSRAADARPPAPSPPARRARAARSMRSRSRAATANG